MTLVSPTFYNSAFPFRQGPQHHKVATWAWAVTFQRVKLSRNAGKLSTLGRLGYGLPYTPNPNPLPKTPPFLQPPPPPLKTTPSTPFSPLLYSTTPFSYPFFKNSTYFSFLPYPLTPLSPSPSPSSTSTCTSTYLSLPLTSVVSSVPV
jgi:hypothetical protein